MAMLGAPCSPCCGCQCPPGEELPDNVTVALSGLTKSNTQSNLLSLSFSACFGSGAAGTISAPAGYPEDAGPIESVTLTGAGSGYAKLGRVAPSLTVTAPPGTGATFNVSLTNEQDECGLDTWVVESISVSGGSGYADGSQVTITPQEGDTTVESASATLYNVRGGEPEYEITAPNGTGAAFSATLSSNNDEPETYSFTDISVDSGGTGYLEGAILSIEMGDDVVEQSSAFATISVNRIEPSIGLSVQSGGGGTGAVLTPTLTEQTYSEGGLTKKYWTVSAIEIESGGTNYQKYNTVLLQIIDGQDAELSFFYADVSSVDGNGSITGFTIYDGGSYFKGGGVIESVNLISDGQYYVDTGVPESVSIDYGGRFYRESETAEPYVAEVTVSINQTPPSDGTGAIISAVVNADPADPGFGSIQSLAIDNPGDDYLKGLWLDCNVKVLNGREFALPILLTNSGNLLALDFASCFGSGAAATVTAGTGIYGVNDGPIQAVTLTSGGSGYAKIGREQPSVVIEAGVGSPGAGATFTPTFAQRQDACGLDYWVLDSVAVSGGTCYGVLGRSIDTEAFVASVPGGTGAVLSVELEEDIDDCGAKVWRVSEVAVSLEGQVTPYEDNTPVTITADGVVVREAAEAVLRTGEGGIPVSVTVTSPGEYFIKGPNELLQVLPATINDKVQTAAQILVQSDEDGNPQGLIITNPGKYYRENKSLSPYVASVTVTLLQLPPSAGTGATITATVDSNPYSNTFGRVASLQIQDAGDGYLRSTTIKSCIYQACAADGTITLTWKGYHAAPVIQLTTPDGDGCSITFTADEGDAPFGCDEMSFVAPEPAGGTATVTAGGEKSSCAEIYAANTINLTIIGEDATVHYAREQGFGACCGTGCAFAAKTTGGDYDGTFACEYQFTDNLGRRHYEYDLGELCGKARVIGVRVSQNAASIEAYLTNVVCYLSHNFDGPEMPAFQCDSTETCFGIPDFRHSVRDIGIAVTCLCDLDSFSVGVSGFSGISSTENRVEGFLTNDEFVAAVGDPLIRVIRAEVVD